jgi:putative transposase
MQIRSDNGPDFISQVLAIGAKKMILNCCIQPCNPQQNAYVERFNRTVRHDWLVRYLFESIEDVQQQATNWLWTYNHERPNKGVDGVTPKQKLALVT